MQLTKLILFSLEERLSRMSIEYCILEFFVDGLVDTHMRENTILDIRLL